MPKLPKLSRLFSLLLVSLVLEACAAAPAYVCVQRIGTDSKGDKEPVLYCVPFEGEVHQVSPPEWQGGEPA